MMKTYLTPLRPAIAMIELIFALVIMGITLMSAPMLLSMSVQSSNTAMQQESIAAASSQISLILTYPWDEGDTNDTTGYGILNTAGDTELNSTNRWGYTREFNTAPLKTTATSSAKFGTGDTKDNNDMDDFDGKTQHVTLYQAETSSLNLNQGEYLKSNQFDMNSSVTYVKDKVTYSSDNVVFNNPNSVTAATSSIKRITVTLTDTTGAAEHSGQSVSVYAFACNIGDGSIAQIRVGDPR